MRKNYIYLVLLLVFNTGMFAQKVILTPTAVNGASVSSNGPINLGGTPSSAVSLGIRVEMPTIPGNTGTINIYSLNGLNANIVTGGNGGVLIFNEGNVASRSFVVNLNWSSFPTAGGFIFAEYKTASGVTYKSGYISVTKNATMGRGTINPPADAPNPSKIANTLCCNQTIRLGEKPAPIVGSQYLNPYENYIHGINNRWNVNNGRILSLDNATKTLYLDYTTELKNITVTRELGYNGNGNYPNKSNAVTITVVPSPILSNKIDINGSINSDGSIEITTSNPKNIFGDQSAVNLNILQNPFYISKGGISTTMVDKYEWEYSIIDGTPEERTWKTIPNQFSHILNSTYLPRSNSSKDNLYAIRRIAIYQNLKIASNLLNISMRSLRNNNTICCDQTLEVSSSNTVENPSIITGETTISNKNTYLFYQWQSQTINERDSKFSNWINIPHATSKDYTPPTPEFVPGIGRNQPTTIPTYNYRRIATDNSYLGETYYSNEISITPRTNVYNFSLPWLVYPNPATSIINIEDTRVRKMAGDILLTDVTIDIVNIMGNVVNSNNFSLINPNLVSINISNLAIGIYFINISNSKGRGYFQQFTFVKN